MLALPSGCGDWPWPQRPVSAACRILCSNVQGLSGNLSDLISAPSRYDVLFVFRDFGIRYASRIRCCWFLIWLPSLVQCRMPRARGMAACVRDGYREFRQPRFECGCCEMPFFEVCGGRQNFFVSGLYRSPDVDCRIFDCLLTSMAALQMRVHLSWVN